jgi:hypothetical protein
VLSVIVLIDYSWVKMKVLVYGNKKQVPIIALI